MTHVEHQIRLFCECCACGISMSESENINFLTLNKLATWVKPVGNNVYAEDKRPRAMAIVCDQCIEKDCKPRFAVEFRRNISDVVYHDVYTLDNLPPLFPIAKLDEHGCTHCPKCAVKIISLDNKVLKKGLNRCPVCKAVFEIMDEAVNVQGRPNPNPV